MVKTLFQPEKIETNALNPTCRTPTWFFSATIKGIKIVFNLSFSEQKPEKRQFQTSDRTEQCSVLRFWHSFFPFGSQLVENGVHVYFVGDFDASFI